MRHRVAGRKLSRTCQHRLALRRNLVSSLFEHGTISTTIEKAKEVRGFAEKLITLAKKGNLQARRRAISLLNDRGIYVEENGKSVKKGTVIGKLFSEIGPMFLERPGGYTRIVKLGKRRLGDNGELVLLQLVEEKVTFKPKKKPVVAKAPVAAAPKTEVEEVEETVADDVETTQEESKE